MVHARETNHLEVLKIVMFSCYVCVLVWDIFSLSFVLEFRLLSLTWPLETDSLSLQLWWYFWHSIIMLPSIWHTTCQTRMKKSGERVRSVAARFHGEGKRKWKSTTNKSIPNRQPKYEKMKSSTLIALRFMSLMGHLVMSITLLSSKRYIVEMCVDWEKGDPASDELYAANVQVTTAFSLMISFLAIELFGFFSGASMFSAPQSFFSFISHSLACIGLGTFVIDRWDCTLMWLVFIFFSVLPTISEIVIFVGVYILKRPV